MANRKKIFINKIFLYSVCQKVYSACDLHLLIILFFFFCIPILRTASLNRQEIERETGLWKDLLSSKVDGMNVWCIQSGRTTEARPPFEADLFNSSIVIQLIYYSN